MSLDAIQQCWHKDFPADLDGIKPALVVAVSLALADVVNEKHGNEFYGSLTGLAEKARVSRPWARRVVEHLVESGVLVVVQNRPGRSTRYRWTGVNPETQLPGPGNSSCRDLETPVAANTIEPNRNPTDPTGPAAAGDGWIPAALSKACPVKDCKAPAVQPCSESSRSKRSPSGVHFARLARAVGERWYEGVRECTGRVPASPPFPAVVGIAERLLKGDRHPSQIAEAVTALYTEGRTITGQTVEHRIDRRRPPSSSPSKRERSLDALRRDALRHGDPEPIISRKELGG